jgi:hypothetical protein
MAKKLDPRLNCFFEATEENEFSNAPLEPETLSEEWLRRNPRWTTDKLMEPGWGAPGTEREYDGGHL